MVQDYEVHDLTEVKGIFMKNGIDGILVSSPETCGGRIRIDGTRITVQQIAVWYKQGYSPEELADHYPHLTLAQVYTALAYYHANKSEIETALAYEKQEAERLEREYMKMRSRNHADSLIC